MKLAIEVWDREFGTSIARPELEPSDARVDPSVEKKPSQWKPLRPPKREADRAVFVDGVRRIDALVWITIESTTRMGLCASYAAGLVEADNAAKFHGVLVRRGFFTGAAVDAIETSFGRYPVLAVEGETVEGLTSGIQERLRELEVEAAGRASAAELIVVDGPLSTHHTMENAVGYVKTHRVSYLSEELHRVVHALDPGERTPLFSTATSWRRFSSYLRLPGPRTHPWAGIVRLEVSGKTPVGRAVELADLAAATLPRYASIAYKEPRAPQNLFPIGGLERELRRRLGDAGLVNRALRAAAGT